MSNRVFLGRDMASFAMSPAFAPYTKVVITDDNESSFEAGDDTGRTLEASCPWGDQAMADSMLAAIKGYVYKPFEATGALLDPAAELGDGVTANGVYSVLARIDTSFDAAMLADIGAPADEEIDHEYQYSSPSDREVNRKINQTRAEIIQTAEEIRLEVSNEVEGLEASFDVKLDSITATVSAVQDTLEGSISRISTLEQTATSITAKVESLETDLQGTAQNVSVLQQTAVSITARVESVETDLTGTKEDVSVLEQTATSITTRVTSVETGLTSTNRSVSEVTQTASKINWVVASGTSASNFTLTDRAISLVASKIDLTGYVTFSSLRTAGSTVVNGGNITTGTIDASKVTVTNLNASNIKSGKISAEYIDVANLKVGNLYSGTYSVAGMSGNSLVLGNASMSGDYVNSVRMNAPSLYLGSTAVVESGVLRPAGTNVSLGSSSNRWSNLFVTAIKVGTSPMSIDASGITGSSLTFGTSSTPINRIYAANLYADYFSNDGNAVVCGSGAKVGFFGSAGASRQSVNNSATVATLITALKAYGLIY